jgi:hypothetical protein
VIRGLDSTGKLEPTIAFSEPDRKLRLDSRVGFTDCSERLRCRFARFKLRAYFLWDRSKRCNLFLQLLDFAVGI